MEIKSDKKKFAFIHTINMIDNYDDDEMNDDTKTISS